MVDVDGSYLERKHKQMIDAGMTVTPIGAPAGTPLAGWEVMTEANVKDFAKKLPQVTSGDSLSKQCWLAVYHEYFSITCCVLSQWSWSYSE